MLIQQVLDTAVNMNVIIIRQLNLVNYKHTCTKEDFVFKELHVHGFCKAV